jgi:hypothetical protein
VQVTTDYGRDLKAKVIGTDEMGKLGLTLAPAARVRGAGEKGG